MRLRRIRLALHWQIMIAIVLAAAAGLAAGEQGTLFGLRWLTIFDFFGSLFLNALKMIILPLIAASIIASIASMGEGLGLLGGRTVAFYLLSTSLAVLVGLAFVNLVAPGIADGAPASKHNSRAAVHWRSWQTFSCAWCRPTSSSRLRTMATSSRSSSSACCSGMH